MRDHQIAVALAAMCLTAASAIMIGAGQPAASAPAPVPPAATQPAPAAKPAPEFKVEEMATGLRAPWTVVFLPDGRVFFTEREGRVRVIQDGKLAAELALSVPDIKSWTKMGLLSMVLAPDFASNGHIYLAENHGDDKQNFLRIVRYREQSGKLVEPVRLIDSIPAYLNHTGCKLLFGPDGKLYITTGDADKPPLSQDLKSLAGKILRLNPDGTIPSDNPFIGRDDANPAVWSYGHRNPQGLAFQPGTGTLFAPEHGPDGGDEINIVRKGANYGWPVVSHKRSREGMVSPLLEFTPSIAPACATFYTGKMFPTLQGDLLVACLRGEAILRVQLDGERVVSTERLLHQKLGRLREVTIAPDGAIWVTTSEFDPPEGRKTSGYDKVLRLTPTGSSTTSTDSIPEPATLPRPIGAAAIYEANCAACHGRDSEPGLHSSLFDGKWTMGSSDDDIRRVTHDGAEAAGMPAFGDKLTAAEILELVKFIREKEKANVK